MNPFELIEQSNLCLIEQSNLCVITKSSGVGRDFIKELEYMSSNIIGDTFTMDKVTKDDLFNTISKKNQINIIWLQSLYVPVKKPGGIEKAIYYKQVMEELLKNSWDNNNINIIITGTYTSFDGNVMNMVGGSSLTHTADLIINLKPDFEYYIHKNRNGADRISGNYKNFLKKLNRIEKLNYLLKEESNEESI
jgi:hypothetical protein